MRLKRALMTICHSALRVLEGVAPLRGMPVRAVVLTPARRVVMVWHSYVPGWHFPGGALRRRETAEQGILRELREEIGLISWKTISPIDYVPPRSSDPAVAFFVLTGARYCFRPNLEIDRVAEIDFDHPMSPGQRAILESWRDLEASA